jgi:hypothetical protein
MLGTGAHLAVGAVERTCKELGVDPPQGYVEQLRAADMMQANLAKFSNRETGHDLVEAVLASVSDGVHPADDERVRRLLVMQQLQAIELHRQADARAKQIVGDAVCQYSDELARLWSDATAQEGAVLWETAQNSVFADVTDLAGISPAQLVDAAAHQRWIAAATAGRRLDSAASGFASLLSATGLRYPQHCWPLILAGGLGVDELAEVGRSESGRRPTAWQLARLGAVPALAHSLADFAASVGAVGAEQSARDEAARQLATPSRFN